MIPLTLDDYIGQEKAKRSLRISIAAAKKTGTPLAHLLICSPYGLGKTTLANIIANEVGMPFFNVNATNLKDVRSLSLYFSKIQDSCIIFIDEIHTLKKEVQTVLLSIMTDFTVNFIDENGEEQHYDLPQFTLIGATTQAGELLKPFLNRFAVLELEDYTDDEKHILVESKFKKLGYEATEEAIDAISRRCRGVPRTIETYAKGIIDVALTRDETVITEETTDIYFEIHEIDDNGLTKNDIKILKILDEAAKPLALVTIESKSGIQKEDIEYRYEPYMIKLGLMDKTDRGRIITRKGIKYLHPELDDGKDGEADEGVDNGEQPETDEPVDAQPEAAQPADTQGEEPEYYDPSDDGDILDQAERALDGDGGEQSDSSSFFDAIKDDDGKEGE
jgi:Holliday junction DNA helicase RuvB